MKNITLAILSFLFLAPAFALNIPKTSSLIKELLMRFIMQMMFSKSMQKMAM